MGLTGWLECGEREVFTISRCKLSPPRSTPGEQAVEAAGWIPFWNFDQPLVREDIEIVGRTRTADAMCASDLSAVVFVGGRLANVLVSLSLTAGNSGQGATASLGCMATVAL
jgi:hypothetical protein